MGGTACPLQSDT